MSETTTQVETQVEDKQEQAILKLINSEIQTFETQTDYERAQEISYLIEEKIQILNSLKDELKAIKKIKPYKF